MNNFKLTVNVFNGERPPLPIIVYLAGPDGSQFSFQKDQSFEWSTFLPAGDYRLTINGTNPFEGTTTASIEGSFCDTPIPGLNDSRNSKLFTMYFFFCVQ